MEYDNLRGRPRTLICNNMVDEYPEIVERIYRYGSQVRARDKLTFELQGLTVISTDPSTNRVKDDPDVTEFVESELETVMAGDDPDVKADEELIERLDLESDGTFFEAGIREAISENWDTWVHRFRKVGAGTRKNAAVFTRPSDDDPPCTLFIQFLVRNGMLHMYTLNRSQDMLWGFPVDMELFETMLCKMAQDISEVNEVPVGYHWHTMISAHVYEEQWEQMQEIIN